MALASSLQLPQGRFQLRKAGRKHLHVWCAVLKCRTMFPWNDGRLVSAWFLPFHGRSLPSAAPHLRQDVHTHSSACMHAQSHTHTHTHTHTHAHLLHCLGPHLRQDVHKHTLKCIHARTHAHTHTHTHTPAALPWPTPPPGCTRAWGLRRAGSSALPCPAQYPAPTLATQWGVARSPGPLPHPHHHRHHQGVRLLHHPLVTLPQRLRG